MILCEKVSDEGDLPKGTRLAFNQDEPPAGWVTIPFPPGWPLHSDPDTSVGD